VRALFLKAFKGQFLVEMLVRARGLIILPIAARALGPSGYGWIAFAAAITGLVGTIATLGMPAAMSRFLPGKQTDDERACIFWPGFASCVVSVTSCAALTIVAFAVAPLAPSGIPFSLIVLAATNVVSNELKLYLYGFWRYTLDLDHYYRFLTVDAVLVGAAQIFVLVVLDAGPLAVIGSGIAVDAALLAVALGVLARRLPWYRPSRAVIAPLFKFGLPLGVTGLLNWANNTADRFFVQAYRGSAALGVYSVGYNLGFLAVGVFATPLFAIFSSVMFRAWDHGRKEEAERLLQRCSSVLLLATLPMILSLGFFGRPFVELMAGTSFVKAHDYVVLVAVGYLMMFLGDLYGYPLWLHNRQYLYSLSMVVSVGVNITGNAILVPRYGAMGSAVATTASLGLLAIALVIINIRSRYSRPPILAPLAITVTAVCCWWLASLAWPSSPTFVDTLLFSVATTIAFAVLAYVLRLVPSDLAPAALRRRLAAS
jgi:O-antigen/teichoic acid export membrane protein